MTSLAALGVFEGEVVHLAGSELAQRAAFTRLDELIVGVAALSGVRQGVEESVLKQVSEAASAGLAKADDVDLEALASSLDSLPWLRPKFSMRLLHVVDDAVAL